MMAQRLGQATTAVGDRRDPAIGAATRIVAAILLAALVATGCMPERRTESTDASAAVDTAPADTASDVATDAGDATKDQAGDASDAGDAVVDSKPLPVGCQSDFECADLVDLPCRIGVCNLETGLCQVVDDINGTPCNPNDCMPDATCLAGECSGTVTDCDDDDPCTEDDCQPIGGCIHPDNAAPCDDGDACTAGDVCDAGACKGEPIACQGSQPPCLVASCAKDKGCVVEHAELAKGATVTCNDDFSCTTTDHCEGGDCIGVPLVCKDDGNPCTLEGCVPSEGKCASTPPPPTPTWVCSDNNPCTIEDICQGTQCLGKKKDCSDGNACTVDGCDPNIGCTYVKAQKGVICDDLKQCTDLGSCDGDGGCLGNNKNCDDGNLCTVDACKEDKGCTHDAPQGSLGCSDGDPCTDGDSCVNLVCKGAISKCDDGDPCTTDGCGGAGCTHTVVSNGTSCGGGQCWGGGCVVAKCGNGACEYNESTVSCADDCPAGGGACDPTDATCVKDCVKTKCNVPAAACDANDGCTKLVGCADACPDASCAYDCLAKAPPQSVALWRSLQICESGKCLKNGWSGKNCKATEPQFVLCVQSCQSALCVVEEATCYASAGCEAIAKCADLCTDGSAQCVKACFAKGSAEDVSVYDTLTVCMNLKCL